MRRPLPACCGAPGWTCSKAAAHQAAFRKRGSAAASCRLRGKAKHSTVRLPSGAAKAAAGIHRASTEPQVAEQGKGCAILSLVVGHNGKELKCKASERALSS